jgi:GNAT superfamily N-acetyltransferase
MRLTTVEPGPRFTEVFTGLLAPAFPPDELGTEEQLREAVKGGVCQVVAAVDDAGTPVGAAVAEWSPATRILLLAYLAVRPGQRAHGVGGALLEHGLTRWLAEYDPLAFLAEVEHPDAHPASPAHGDPGARLRFYHRHGGRALAMPYFQPALGPGMSRVYGLILTVLWAGPEAAGAGPDTLSGALLTRYLREYFLETEGAVPDDPATRAVWQALDRPGGVPLVSLAEPAKIPVSQAAGGSDSRVTAS